MVEIGWSEGARKWCGGAGLVMMLAGCARSADAPGARAEPTNAAQPPAKHAAPPPDVAALLARICAAGPCTAAFARVEPWRDSKGAAALYVFHGDFNRCSHPPLVFYDRNGREVGSAGTGPAPTSAPPRPNVHAQLTAGLTAGKSWFCADSLPNE